MQTHIWHRLYMYMTLLLFSLTVLSGCKLVGGNFSKQPHEIDTLSAAATDLIRASLKDIDTSLLRDYHTHIVGLNPDISGTFVNESWQSIFNPAGYVKFIVYLNSSGISDTSRADEQYMERLNQLIKHHPGQGRYGILAFDYFHDEHGNPDKKLSTFHVPNNYIMKIWKQSPAHYFPVVSIHPYRKDALEVLEAYAQEGVRLVKWLPNAMGINPASEEEPTKSKLEAYYRILQRYNMTLISHTGDEAATEADEFQQYGNPLYLKKPLSMGVRIVMAHVASLGECKESESDLCAPGTPYIDLALEMMRDKAYKNLLLADLSAVTQVNRMDYLDKIIEASDIHANLVNGSDYPLPAVNIVIQTLALADAGHITWEERDLLNEIYHVNPLLFDLVLKRTIKHTTTGEQLPAAIFTKHDDIDEFRRDAQISME